MERKATKRKLDEVPDSEESSETEAEEWEDDDNAELLQTLANMVDNEQLADVRFLVGPDAVPVHACRMFLSLRSPVFRAMLARPSKEPHEPADGSTSTDPALQHAPSSCSSSSSVPSTSSAFGVRIEVRLPDAQPLIFRQFLLIVHTNQLPPERIEADIDEHFCQDMFSLYRMATYFMVSRAQTLIARVITENCLTKKTAFLLLAGCIADAPDLTKELLRYISWHARSLLRFDVEGAIKEVEEQWLALSAGAVLQVLETDLVGLEEVEVFEAVRRWCQVDKRSLTDQRQVLTCVQMELISPHQLAEKVDPTNLFNDKQMKVAYKTAATAYRMEAYSPFYDGAKQHQFQPLQHNNATWCITLEKQENGSLSFQFTIKQLLFSIENKVSLAGIKVQVFRNRVSVCRGIISGMTVVPGVRRFPLECPAHGECQTGDEEQASLCPDFTTRMVSRDGGVGGFRGRVGCLRVEAPFSSTYREELKSVYHTYSLKANKTRWLPG
ncbi:BTB POZ domain-containing protein [Balamuthia mandrillaris]